MLRSFSVSNCCGGQRPLSLTCWSKRPKKKTEGQKRLHEKEMLSFFGSFFLTDSASLFFCYHGRTLPFIDGVFSRNQVNSTLRGVRAFAVFFFFFFISRLILIYYWLSSSLPVGVFVSLCAAKAPHTSSRTAYFSFCFISSTFGPIFKKRIGGWRKKELYIVVSTFR